MQRMKNDRTPIAPPALLGVIGGGQLGRFFALAGRDMGYQIAVLDPDPGAPAMQVADERIIAGYDDIAALDKMRAICAAVTVEFESVPAGSVRRLEESCCTAPRAESIAVLQDRIREKRFLRAIGLPVASFVPVIGPGDLDTTGCYPGILKLARQSYDGKGQVPVDSPVQGRAAWRDLAERPAVLERRIRLDAELSIILARGTDGNTRCYPPALNRHRDGILELTVAPAPVAAELAARAEDMARRIAVCLDYVGVLAVEFFVSGGGLLVNEVAPRPHNSGHFTIESCSTSQFAQQVRILCGLPLGDTVQRTPAAMVNILGDAWHGGEPDWDAVRGASGAALHLYGKAQARPRRKMGHLTVLGATSPDAAALAENCLRRLRQPAVHSHARRLERPPGGP